MILNLITKMITLLCITLYGDRFFLSVDVFSADELVEVRSEEALRRMGHVMQQGKNYVVNSRDILYFSHFCKDKIIVV